MAASFFLEPTIFDWGSPTAPGSRRKKSSAPCFSVIVDDAEQAVEQANNNPYGLAPPSGRAT